MNPSEARARLIKQCRREILSVLLAIYPGAFSFDDIVSVVLYLEVEDDHVRRDLAYFLQKNYVQCVNNEDGRTPFARRKFSLTASGNEIANQIVTDIALEP